jgi:hypothetical protein
VSACQTHYAESGGAGIDGEFEPTSITGLSRRPTVRLSENERRGLVGREIGPGGGFLQLTWRLCQSSRTRAKELRTKTARNLSLSTSISARRTHENQRRRLQEFSTENLATKAEQDQ